MAWSAGPRVIRSFSFDCSGRMNCIHWFEKTSDGEQQRIIDIKGKASSQCLGLTTICDSLELTVSTNCLHFGTLSSARAVEAIGRRSFSRIWQYACLIRWPCELTKNLPR